MSELTLDVQELAKLIASQNKVELPPSQGKPTNGTPRSRRPNKVHAPSSPCVTKRLEDLSEEDQARINGYKSQAQLESIPTTIKINLSACTTETQRRLLIGQAVWGFVKYGINVTVLYDEITETVTILHKGELDEETISKMIDYQIKFPSVEEPK